MLFDDVEIIADQIVGKSFFCGYAATPDDSISQSPNDCSWRIVLKKSFSTEERNFLGPLMRFAGADVRDHIVSHTNDQGPSYRRHGTL